ncbi:UvrD-helicase domain-containing protein [Kribbella sp. NPDC058245]|uniref:UvrD-helicase domain-containing protein n=1 Tax=Kribbella sp. NPDC058245 TaxID=3346399 RepID=UPI0036F0C142
MVTPTTAQAQVRDHEDLGLLVVAPAGCGKTEALAVRIAGMLSRGTIAHPQRVLVTTFSNRARDNIRDRLRTYISPGVMRDRVTVSNFHGFSARLFRAHASVIGLDSDMILPEHDWVAEQIRERGLGYEERRAVEDILRVANQDGVDDSTLEKHLIARGNGVALDIERQRLAEGRLTYDDLPRMAELILNHDLVADLYRNHFAAVVVDEFQDLTPQQLRIVNRVGYGKTTYAGDLAQGIYSFAGAQPEVIDKQVRAECPTVIKFAESHRSSPAVLGMVNALTGWTGGQTLTCANPDSWPHGGLAGQATFGTVAAEAAWIVATARSMLASAPGLRIGVISRTGPRRRFVDDAFKRSDVLHHRWDDGVLDTETATILKVMLLGLTMSEFVRSSDQLAYLRVAARFEEVHPPTRDSLRDALDWVWDLLRDGLSPDQVRARIRIGDQETLLTAPGVHLLTGHIGKGQQFDFVIVVGAEEGCIPDWRSENDAAALREEARIFSVMISRARHGLIILNAQNVPTLAGKVRAKQPSRFLQHFNTSISVYGNGVSNWLNAASWNDIESR